VTGADGAETFGYNAKGQTTSRQGQILTWDRQGHLTQVTGTGGATAFTYTADGDRLLREDSGGTTLYLGKQEIQVAANGGTPVVTRYFTHGERTVAMHRGSA
jgi:YD repeat-containing protein